MRAGLGGAGVDAAWRNIWEDADAAHFVRSVAGGSETVPTVRIGDEVLVAPKPRHVIDRLVDTAPGLVADSRRWPPLRVAQWLTVVALLVLANVIARDGNDGLSLLVDGVAVAAYLGFRRLRSRAGPTQPAAEETV